MTSSNNARIRAATVTIETTASVAVTSPASVPVPGSHSVLNAQALAMLAQLDPTGANKLLSRVLTTYLLSLARLLGQLAQARLVSDIATVRLVVHTLKSSSASVGALALSAHCGSAEQAVREGRIDALPPILDLLGVEAVGVDAAVRQLLTAG